MLFFVFIWQSWSVLSLVAMCMVGVLRFVVCILFRLSVCGFGSGRSIMVSLMIRVGFSLFLFLHTSLH